MYSLFPFKSLPGWICMVYIFGILFLKEHFKGVPEIIEVGHGPAMLESLTFSSTFFQVLCNGGTSTCITFSTSSVIRIREKLMRTKRKILLRELRLFLRDVTKRLAIDKRFNIFSKPMDI